MWDQDDVARILAAACRQREMGALRAALDCQALAVCDSGGLLEDGPDIVHGPRGVAEVLAGLCWQPGIELTVEAVNGRPGLTLRRADRAVAVIDVLAIDHLIVLWIVLNPAKLRAWHRS